MIRNSWITTTAEVTSVGALWLETHQQYALTLGPDLTLHLHPAHAESAHLHLGRAIGNRLQLDAPGRLKFLAAEFDCAGLSDAAVMLRAMVPLVPEAVRA
ncbi:hypothetical protein [Nocardia sp. N2S4-5]|uniref:hypothetical protein n=1 Tax=Nocardia sp. N2S4-5 TaxID=3351565 RepID=UPI0037D76CD1